MAAINRNIVSVYNTAPNAPATNGLVTVGVNGEATFTWSAASDTQTPTGGLSYNIRIGTWAGGENVVGSMSSLSGATIYRRVPAIGNAQKNLSVTINGLQPSTNYKWAVQAIDSAYQASAWSSERTFNTLPMITGRVTTAKGVPAPGILVECRMGFTSSTGLERILPDFPLKYFTGTVLPPSRGSRPSRRVGVHSLTAHQFKQDFVSRVPGSFRR